MRKHIEIDGVEINPYSLIDDFFSPSENDTDVTLSIKNAIRQLPITDQLIIALYCETQSMSKVAALLHVSTATCFNVIHRIRSDASRFILNIQPHNNPAI